MHSTERHIEIQIPLPGTTGPIRIIFYSARAWMLTVAMAALVVAGWRADWPLVWQTLQVSVDHAMQEGSRLLAADRSRTAKRSDTQRQSSRKL